MCDSHIESEIHVITQCTAYNDLRNDLFLKALNVGNDFDSMSVDDKFSFYHG